MQTLKSARYAASEGWNPGDRARWGDANVTVKRIREGYVMVKPDNDKNTYSADGRDLTRI